MPSVKSYQNRKAEIAKLNLYIAELEYQVRKFEQDNRVLRGMVYKFVEREAELKKQVETSELKIRIHQDYIRRAYYSPVLNTTFLEEIPSCLKPLDAIKYSGERIDNGFDNLPQQLP
jgi:hypothetical protein